MAKTWKLVVRKTVLLFLSFVSNTEAKLLSHYKPIKPIYWSTNWVTRVRSPAVVDIFVFAATTISTLVHNHSNSDW